MALLVKIIILGFSGVLLSTGFPLCTPETACKCRVIMNNEYIADCSGLGLRSTPLFYKTVIEINLSHNQLSVFPDALKLPTALKTLDVSFNKISKFSENFNFTRVPALQILNISNNKLTLNDHTFPSGLFKQLKNLKILNIKNNVIKNSTYIENTITELGKLETLQITLYNNKMFGANFLKLKSLKHLDIAGHSVNGHEIEYLPSDFFKNLPLLRTIDMSSCGLLRIENGSFQATPYLELLDISYNEDLTFRVLTNVTYDLQFTQIKILKANKIHHTFGIGTELFIDDLKYLNNTSLEELYLDYNRLEMTEEGVVTNMPSSLRYVSAGHNRFTMGLYVFEIHKLNVKEINGSFQYLSNNPIDLVPISSKSCDQPKRKLCDNQIPKNRHKEKRGLFSQHSELLFHTLPPILLPKDMERFHFRTSVLQYSIPQLKFHWNNKMKYLDISDNVLNKWIGPILGLNALEYIDLSNNYCDNVSNVFFQNFTNLKSLKINNNLLGFSLENDNGEIFKSLIKLETLNLSTNRISNLHSNVFIGIISLRQLDISKNRLKKCEFEINHMKNLTYIDLSDNQIEYLSENVQKSLDERRKDHNITVAFSGNNILCKCDSLALLKWIHSTDVIQNKTHLTCETDDGNKLKFKDLENIISNLELRCMPKTGLIVGVTIAIVVSVAIVIAGLIYRYRWKIRYLYYIAVTQGLGYSHHATNDGYERTYDYDIFVSYADEDRAFVKNEMIAQLEEERGLRLCIHHKHFIPGLDIAANIINSIHESRKTVLILTKNFFKSYWCVYEFNMARMESIYSRDGKNTLFLVFLEEVSVRDLPMSMLDLVESQSYIEFPNDPQGDVVFWNKIEEAVKT